MRFLSSPLVALYTRAEKSHFFPRGVIFGHGQQTHCACGTRTHAHARARTRTRTHVRTCTRYRYVLLQVRGTSYEVPCTSGLYTLFRRHFTRRTYMACSSCHIALCFFSTELAAGLRGHSLGRRTDTRAASSGVACKSQGLPHSNEQILRSGSSVCLRCARNFTLASPLVGCFSA